MKKLLIVNIFFLSLFIRPPFAFGICDVSMPPLEEKIANSKLIFVGSVIKSESVDVGRRDIDSMVVVKVKEVFRGEPGNEISLYYLKDRKGDECNGARHPWLGELVGKSYEMLFLVDKREGHFFISRNLYRGLTTDPWVKKDLEVLPELIKKADSRVWWNPFTW